MKAHAGIAWGKALSRGWAARMSASYPNTFTKIDGVVRPRYPKLRSPRFSAKESCLLLGSPRSERIPEVHSIQLPKLTLTAVPWRYIHTFTHTANTCDLELDADHGDQLLMAQMGSKQASRK